MRLAPWRPCRFVVQTIFCRDEQTTRTSRDLCAADMLANEKGKEKKDVSSWTGYPGGAPCNVACGLGKLNVPVAFVTCLGQDERGDELVDLISSMHLS